MTPALDALLKDVEAEASAFVVIPFPEPHVDVEVARRITLGRLAAMLRVAVEALTNAGDLASEAVSYTPGYFREKWRMDERLTGVHAALSRIEAMAKGDA